MTAPILAQVEGEGGLGAGVQCDLKILQYDDPCWLRPVIPRLEVEEKVPSEPTPSLCAHCKGDKAVVKSGLGWRIVGEA